MLLILVSISQVFCFQEIQLNKTDTETLNLTIEQQICHFGFIRIKNLKIQINNIKNKTFCPPNSKQFGKLSSSPTLEQPKLGLQSFPAVIESSSSASLVSQVIITLKQYWRYMLQSPFLKFLERQSQENLEKIQDNEKKDLEENNKILICIVSLVVFFIMFVGTIVALIRKSKEQNTRVKRIISQLDQKPMTPKTRRINFDTYKNMDRIEPLEPMVKINLGEN